MSDKLLVVQNFTMVLAYLILIFFIVSIICTSVMLYSILKKGDERNKYIISRACTSTLLIYMAILIVDVIYTITLENNGGFYIENSSILSLGILSIIFTLNLFFNKRKHGN